MIFTSHILNPRTVNTRVVVLSLASSLFLFSFFLSVRLSFFISSSFLFSSLPPSLPPFLLSVWLSVCLFCFPPVFLLNMKYKRCSRSKGSDLVVRSHQTTIKTNCHLTSENSRERKTYLLYWLLAYRLSSMLACFRDYFAQTNCTCCQIELKLADQSYVTVTGLTSPRSDSPVTGAPGVGGVGWRG